jgi:hypothetical protein
MTDDELIELLQLTRTVDDEGTVRWTLNGNLHRIYGPAIEFASGVKHWFHYGNLHRIDGPAVEFPGGGDQYWEKGVFLGYDKSNFKD